MLSKDQRKRLHAALLDGFSDADLRQFVRFDLGENLAAIAGGSNLDATVFNLIEWCEQRRRTVELATSAARERPNNADLRALAAELGRTPGSEPPGEPTAAPSDMPDKESGWSVGTINATNVVLGGDQTNDQRRTEINTGGGAYIQGNVSVGGDFIGRDKITAGDTNRTSQGDTLFASLNAVILLQIDSADQNEAIRLLDQLKQSWITREDTGVAAALDQIASFCPSAIPHLVEAFSHTPLRDQLGPVATEMVRSLDAG
ncbi:MAG: hypothetical protein H6642_06815 [Caldilineaceae bacterium]|nr:hypothetical protein [Caldilineaceae bacterium]